MANSTTVVTFKKDVYPYCAGDVVALTKEQLKQIDKTVESRKLDEAYVKGEQEIDRTEQTALPPNGSAELAQVKAQAKATREEAEAEADAIRQEAEDYASRVRAEADDYAKQTHEQADQEAKAIVEASKKK